MAQRRQGKKSKLGAWLAASLLLHVVFVGKMRQVQLVTAPAREPVKVRVEAAVREQQPPVTANLEHNATKAFAPRPAPKKTETTASASSPAAHSTEAAGPPQVSDRYSDYLPGTTYALDQAQRQGGAGGTLSGDAAFAALTRSIAPLGRFGREFAERVQLPDALCKLSWSGNARLRFKKLSPSRWVVASADGDSYFRAALFEALDELTPLSVAIQYLEQSGADSIKIAADYRTVSPGDMHTPPLGVRVEGHTVFISFVRRVADDRWKMVALPVDPTTVAFDVIAAVTFLAKQGVGAARDYEADPSLKRLRLSPAFARPFVLRP